MSTPPGCQQQSKGSAPSRLPGPSGAPTKAPGQTSRRGRVLPKRVRPSNHTTTATWRRPVHHPAAARHRPPPRAPITPWARLTTWLTVAKIVDSQRPIWSAQNLDDNGR